MNIKGNQAGRATQRKGKTTKTQNSGGANRANRAPKAAKPNELTAAGRKKINTTDSAAISGEKKGSQPINFSSWKDNLKAGKADKDSASQLQESLNKGRSDDKKIAQDGKFGKQTSEAVKQFQKEKGLKVDGIVGKYTKAALERQQNAGSKDPNTTIPSGGIDELNKAVKQQQQTTADKAKGQTGGGFNQLRGADPAKANAQDRATSIPSGEAAQFPKPGILQRLQESTVGRESATVNPVNPPPAPPKVDSIGPVPTSDGMPLYATGA